MGHTRGVRIPNQALGSNPAQGEQLNKPLWHIRTVIGNETRIVALKTQAAVIEHLRKHLPEQPNVAYNVHIRYAIPPVPPNQQPKAKQ